METNGCRSFFGHFGYFSLRKFAASGNWCVVYRTSNNTGIIAIHHKHPPHVILLPIPKAPSNVGILKESLYRNKSYRKY